jgi:hypothetical protein
MSKCLLKNLFVGSGHGPCRPPPSSATGGRQMLQLKSTSQNPRMCSEEHDYYQSLQTFQQYMEFTQLCFSLQVPVVFKRENRRSIKIQVWHQLYLLCDMTGISGMDNWTPLRLCHMLSTLRPLGAPPNLFSSIICTTSKLSWSSTNNWGKRFGGAPHHNQFAPLEHTANLN